jgi:transposase-like protein
MNILETAIESAGGVTALAKSLGLNQNVVSNWRMRGLPRSWAMVLELKYGQAHANPAPASTETVAPAA